MYTHVTVGALDIEQSRKFYDATFAALGLGPGARFGRWIAYVGEFSEFAVALPLNGEPASCANGGTIGFAAASVQAVDAWYAAGLAAGGSACEDPPGLRDNGAMYLAYLRDPAGNKLCAKLRLKKPES